MLHGKSVFDILLLLGTVQCIGRHSQSPHIHVFPKLALASSCLGRIPQATIALVGINDTPVGMCKDSIMAVASNERPRLEHALPAQLPGFLHEASVLCNCSRRRRVGPRLGLVRAVAPPRRAFVDWTSHSLVVVWELEADPIFVTEGIIMTKFLGRRLGRGDVGLEETWRRLWSRSLGLVRFATSGLDMLSRRPGKGKMNGLGEKAASDLVRCLSEAKVTPPALKTRLQCSRL